MQVNSSKVSAKRKPAAKATKAPARKPANQGAKSHASVAPAAKKPTEAKVKAVVAKPAASKVVRDSFTMTAADHELVKQFKRDAVAAGRQQTKKSEVVRAALQAFAALAASERAKAIGALAPIKTGRPKKERK